LTSGSGSARTVFGRPLWSALIVGEKALGALAAAAGSVGAFWVRAAGHPAALRAVVREALSDDPDNVVLRYLLHLVPSIAPKLALGLAVGLGLLAILLAVEAVGFWFERPWAEMLIIVETAAFLPAEIVDVVRHLRPTAMITLAVNILILVYVARRFRRSNQKGEQPS
jgi:uncharacterized membrane protein (DUF2068 family)